MLALSIRQPYAEMILRGEKTIEYRSRPTKVIGKRFYIYAAKKWAGFPGVEHDTGTAGRERDRVLHAPGPSPTSRVGRGRGDDSRETSEGFPTGVIVGTAVISHCTNGGTGAGAYHWHLTDVRRIAHPRRPKGRPQPVWFRPF